MDSHQKMPTFQPSLRVLGTDAIGKNARLGDLPCTESNKICRFKFDVKMCCSKSFKSWKSLRSLDKSTSSGLQNET